MYVRGTRSERFWAKVNKTNDPNSCWEWTAYKDKGYGQFQLCQGDGIILAHRFSYEELIGPIPEGMSLDHTCHTKALDVCEGGETCIHRRCVNPAHLEPVSFEENVQRGHAGKHWADKTHCPQGHPYSARNTYVNPHNGGRNCRICIAESKRKYRLRTGV